jgi:imidazolonepropionase-like amidohydrolase/Tol biopolymer transport system component
MKHRLAAALLLCASLPLFSQQPPKPPIDKPLAAPPGDPAKEKEPEKPKWDVANPPYPFDVTVPIDVTTGTWMSLDVSPDGREIAFDLLGDLYTMPITGGEARALTSGIPWDMQPRYSPNGKWIAFTSDRSGGDNIWIIDRDGKNPRQVTKESFRLPNSPAWTPDSEFIAARKHYTGTRSLGAGEIWLYHRTGGEGLQMTKRATEQKDDGEPAFSPDGRYLYWSADTTPGKIFEYNKDPNGQIYVIKRLDRDTGKIVDYVTGPGGSIRPTPSPDGRTLAFIRRIRYKSTLFVKDLESGIERPIWNGLDRDMQETWAIQGVYPAMAWMPDSKSIVLWAGGKIRRVDVASKSVAEIPFHVKDTRKTATAVRFPVDVLTGVMAATSPSPPIGGRGQGEGGTLFPVRMLRWVSVSPDGRRVAYVALGHIYVRDLPDGRPKRLTKQTDDFEYFPSWSRDSKSLVYVAWNDDTLGSVRVAAVPSGASRAVTEKPGHYLDPVFSPDGSKIVYRKEAGGYLVSSAWSADPGIYQVPSAGGKPKLVTEGGLMPRFARASDRVFFLKTEGGGDEAAPPKRVLASIDLDGSDVHEYYVSDLATEFALSPDGKWLAFREGFNAYVTPFVETGRRVEIGPKSKAVPVTRVSRDAGEYLEFSGDSSRLFWSVGPELFERDLKDAFTFLPGSPEKVPEPAAHGLNISFDEPVDIPSGTIAFTGGRVVTMKGDEVIEDGVVLVEGNRIRAVGPRGSVAVPAGAKTIDVSGKTVLPGFIDAHAHGSWGADGVIPRQNWRSDATLAFGVTTIHDPSNDTGEVFSAAELARAGLIRASRIFSTGTILYGANADFRADIDSLDDARTHVRRMKAVGAISVKSYQQPRREQRQQILAAAREAGIMVVPEGGSLFEMDMTMVVDGHTTLEHTVPVPHIYGDVEELWPPTKVAYTPTLLVGYGGLFGEDYWYEKTNVWEDPKLSKFVPPFVLDPRSRRRLMAPEDEWNHFDISRIADTLDAEHVLVNTGAHGQREGLGFHWELWMLVQGGMSPHEALRCATEHPAESLGMDRDIGSLEPGKLADVVVIDGNPLKDIRQSEKVTWVMVNGRLYDASTMDEVAPTAKKRAKYWWER